MDETGPSGTEVEVDARGLTCPLPVIELARAVGDHEVGTVVVVLADDPAAKVDIPVWCRMQRHQLLAVETVEDGWRFGVRKVHEG